jgi:hypothetical protein
LSSEILEDFSQRKEEILAIRLRRDKNLPGFRNLEGVVYSTLTHKFVTPIFRPLRLWPWSRIRYRHSREGGNPVSWQSFLDSRIRRNDGLMTKAEPIEAVRRGDEFAGNSNSTVSRLKWVAEIFAGHYKGNHYDTKLVAPLQADCGRFFQYDVITGKILPANGLSPIDLEPARLQQFGRLGREIVNACFQG